MNNEKTTCSIQNLPYEILCKIFDYLDIMDVKNCSRTCQHWKEIIFSDSYIKRFKLNFIISQLTYEKIHLLEQSDRLYRNLDITLPPDSLKLDSAIVFNGIYSIICYPKLEQLVMLKISLTEKPNNAIKMITDAIPRMKVLRELYINSIDAWGYEIKYTIKIRSNSIQLLDVQCLVPMVVKAPKLSSLRIYSVDRKKLQRDRNHMEKLLYSSQFPNLKSLELDKGKASSLASINNVQHVLSFFYNLGSLEKLNLKNVNLSGYLFKAICENCTNLTELSIESLYIMKISTLRNLSNLAKLRHLQFKDIKCMESLSFRSVVLPYLESLGIGCFPMLYETLEAFKSITKITILDEKPTKDFIAVLAIKMPKLKQVELAKFSISAIESLNQLPSVEVLTVAFEITMLTRFKYIVTTIKEIRSLESIAPSFNNITILRLFSQLFPNLQLITAGKNVKLKIKN